MEKRPAVRQAPWLGQDQQPAEMVVRAPERRRQRLTHSLDGEVSKMFGAETLP